MGFSTECKSQRKRNFVIVGEMKHYPIVLVFSFVALLCDNQRRGSRSHVQCASIIFLLSF